MSIETIVLCLGENVHGANGDLDAEQIRERLVEDIHEHTDYYYAGTGLVPIERVAGIVLSIWRYMDDQINQESCENLEKELALQEIRRALRRLESS
jgi:hypothetical protein